MSNMQNGKTNDSSINGNGVLKKNSGLSDVEFEPPLKNGCADAASAKGDKAKDSDGKGDGDTGDGSAELTPVPYFRLFRYARAAERFLVFLGLVLAVLSACCLPLVIILYGEFTTLLVDRNMENVTSSPTLLLQLFNGGRILVNGSWEERREAILEDAAAFAVSAVACAALHFSLAVLSVTCLNYSAHKQIGRVRRLFFRSVLRQDMAWFDTRDPATFATRLTENLDKMQDGIGEKLGMFVYLSATFVASVAMSFVHGWKLTLVVLSCAPIIIVATALVAKMQSSLAAKEQEAYGAAGAAAEEALAAARTVAAFAGQQKEADRYADRLQPAERMGCRRGLFSGLGGGVMWFIIYCSYSLALWYGVELIIDSRAAGDFEYTPAILVIVLFGVLSGAMNMGLSSPHLEAFSVARGAAASVFAVLEREPAIDALSEDGLRPAAPPAGELELRGVHFSYPARPQAPVLRGLHLRVRPGETVALVGPSGCGKSTVLQLLQRLYDPLEGQVLLDGDDVRTLNVQWLRAQLAVVEQEPALFAASVADNIRLAREDATQADIEEAAKEAGAHDFVTRLPQGYATVVGDRGAQLSGGQKQRIALARALVRRPRILLLDEATSALDPQSEAQVQAALAKGAAAAGRTTLLVAHRLSTVRAADRIAVLDAGGVVEEGAHAELLARGGRYHALVHAQDAHAKEGDVNMPVEERNAENGNLPSEEPISTGPGVDDVKALDETSTEKQDPSEEGDIIATPLGRIMAANRPEWLHITVGCLASAMVGSSLPFFAVLFGEVYKSLSLEDASAVREATQVLAGLFVVLGLMAGLGTFLQGYLFAVAGARLTRRLRQLAFAALLRQEAAFFDHERHSVGALCARLSGDAASLQGVTGSTIATILQSVATLFIGILLSLFYSWKLTLVAMLGVPLVFTGVFLESRLMHGQGLYEKEALESTSKVAVEALGNVRTAHALGAGAFVRRFDVALAAAEAAGRRKMRWRGVVFAMGQCSWPVAYAIALYYGGVLIANEGLPYENVIKVSEALIFGAWMLGQSLAFAPNLNSAKLAAGRLFALLDRQPQLDPGPPMDGNTHEVSGRVEYEDVEFYYPTRPSFRVLRGLNLEVSQGATVALVGPSGCGKSTCIQLLQRLYDPTSGRVMVGGRASATLPLEHLRAQMGLVSQEPVLFDRSVAENIAYGDNTRTVPMDEIIAAAKAANIHTFVASLPQGYETRLGAKGTQFSGGQKQRVAIARALVRNPRILLLDEATSALDAQSEKVVQQALEDARQGRTCVVIAHRLATVQQADVICVVSGGRIAEKGSHGELLARGGLYAQMLRRDASQHPTN